MAVKAVREGNESGKQDGVSVAVELRLNTSQMSVWLWGQDLPRSVRRARNAPPIQQHRPSVESF
jgi:hypothetical protein